MRWIMMLALAGSAVSWGVASQAQGMPDKVDAPEDAMPTTLAEAGAAPLVQEAGDLTLEPFLWVNRPIIVFADSPADPRFVQQMQFIERDGDALRDRDVVVLTDTDPTVLSPLRERLRPRGFMLVLVGKDGGVKLRKPLPWSVREISRTIDKMPIRQQEVRDRRATREGS